MLISPRQIRPGQRDDNARLQKLERQYAELAKRVDRLELVNPASGVIQVVETTASNPTEIVVRRGRPRKAA